MGRKRNKSGFIFLILIVIAAVAFFTNPDKEAHKEAVVARSNQVVKEIIAERNDVVASAAWQMAGEQLLTQFVDSYVTVDNYYIFSIPKVNWDGKSYPIGVGAFDKVYITKDFNKNLIEPIINDMENKIMNLLPGFPS